MSIDHTPARPVACLLLLCLGSGPVLAHKAGLEMQQRHQERQQAEARKDQQTWDDFISAVKQQEKKQSAENTARETAPGAHEHDAHPAPTAGE